MLLPATGPSGTVVATRGAAVDTALHAVDTLPPLLVPGVGCADHAPGVRSAFVSYFPDVKLMGCWPHVCWHYSHGKLLKKDHRLFDTIKAQLPELHECHTVGMFDVLVDCIGKLWTCTPRDKQLDTLWNQILVEPNNQWHLGVTQVPGATPSQQPQESWHNGGVMQRIKSELKASTAYVLERSLASVMTLDGACASTAARARDTLVMQRTLH